MISEVEILDQVEAERYRTLAARSIAAHGGRYLVRGATPEAIEGAWDPRERLVIVEFPDAAAARRWYDSPEYAEARALRRTALRRRLLFAEGHATGSASTTRTARGSL